MRFILTTLRHPILLKQKFIYDINYSHIHEQRLIELTLYIL